jgi:hypothetical protein
MLNNYVIICFKYKLSYKLSLHNKANVFLFYLLTIKLQYGTHYTING